MSDSKNVVIKITQANGSEPFSWNALLFGDLILTSGSLLGGLLPRKTLASLSPDSLLLDLDSATAGLFSAEFYQGTEVKPCRLKCLWRCGFVSEFFRRHRDVLAQQSEEDEAGNQEELALAEGLFVVFEAADSEGATHSEVLDQLARLQDRCHAVSPLGRVSVVSSPFGAASPELLSECRSDGIVSSVYSAGRLFLTDAKLMPFSDGAPVFGEGAVVGLVISPLVWSRGEWLGFTLCVGVQALLEPLRPKKLFPLSLALPSPLCRRCYNHPMTRAFQGVLHLNTGPLRGSGFAFTPDLGRDSRGQHPLFVL